LLKPKKLSVALLIDNSLKSGGIDSNQFIGRFYDGLNKTIFFLQSAPVSSFREVGYDNSNGGSSGCNDVRDIDTGIVVVPSNKFASPYFFPKACVKRSEKIPLSRDE
jgi:hypothetical protein